MANKSIIDPKNISIKKTTVKKNKKSFVSEFNNIESYCQYLIDDLAKYVENSGFDGVVVGMSGGIDSAVVASIAIKALGKESVQLIYLPINYDKLDETCISSFVTKYKMSYKTIDLNPIYKSIANNFNDYKSNSYYDIAMNNIKPRLRVNYLYTIAQVSNSLVLGTSNLVEMYLGYFTKYGDNAADLFMLKNLLKQDVYDMAKYLNIPQLIIQRAPSANLYPNQTDESEFGFSYKTIDNYLNNQDIDNYEQALITQRHQSTQHKRNEYEFKPYRNYRGINEKL